ncbi:cupin domain-containing protein [Bremerella cremea]|uniref:Cupin type-2 domain-containing protein n=1 Tax=Blastopirellula marina TaxID=124 RepID=A0A2S8FC87_9BACT|nr:MULTISPECIES: cupin domain-containing protein [Pirellulaceae]PQO29740.1 hypothetical protein C5Y83_27240 [Blastopirellula marina]RCS43042.1 cupin domain-containing protein [Bremerella cremea]
MTTSNESIAIQDLPGIGQPTTVIDLAGESKHETSPTANYLRLAKEERTSTHVSSGEVLLFCVAGELELTVDGQHYPLRPNQLLHVMEGKPYRAEAKRESALLVTTVFADHNAAVKKQAKVDRNNEVDEALEETFPASDPPSYNSTTIT